MKKIFSIIALSLALCAVAGAAAQTKSPVSAPVADTVLLSESTDGNYRVRTVLVNNQDDADYEVRYQINVARLSTTLDGNADELAGLGEFVGRLDRDTLLRVKSVRIVGYSSPDGPLKLNQTLAQNRARDFRSYVDRKYDFSKKYAVTTDWVAEDWEMCRALVAGSSIPDRQTVLKVIDGPDSSEAKEAKLKAMPAVWEYMKRSILPPLRRVELSIVYGHGRIMELRTMIEPPKPAPKPKPEPRPQQQECCPAGCDCCEIEESITGIIIEMDDVPLDF